MQMPVLSESGFEGRRWIVDDYFFAGESLSAGDAVGIHEDGDGQPKVYKVALNVDQSRAIGFVYTPANKQIGDRVAGRDALVPVVLKGIAQAFTAGPVGVGDPIAPAGSIATPPQKYGVARVKVAGAGDTIVGRCLSVAPNANQVIDVLVDVAGVGDGVGAGQSSVEPFAQALAADCWHGVCDRWDGVRGSVNIPGKPARFYSFEMDEAAEVAVYLVSDEDTKLYLLDGRDGSEIANGDGEIVQSLQPGGYTVEAVAHNPQAASGQHFSVGISLPVSLANLVLMPGPNSVEVSCDGPDVLPVGASYEVSVSEGATSVKTVGTDSFPVTVDGLEVATDYTVEISVRFETPGLEAQAFSNTLSGSATTDDFGREVGQDSEFGGKFLYTAKDEAYTMAELSDALATLEGGNWTQLEHSVSVRATALGLVDDGWASAHAIVHAKVSDWFVTTYSAFEYDAAPVPSNLTAEQTDITGTFVRYEFEEPTDFPEAADYRLEVVDSTEVVHSFVLADAGSGLVSVTPGDTYTVKVASRLFAPDGKEVLSDFVTASIDVTERLWADSLSDPDNPVPAPTSLTVYPEGQETGGFGSGWSALAPTCFPRTSPVTTWRSASPSVRGPTPPNSWLRTPPVGRPTSGLTRATS